MELRFIVVAGAAAVSLLVGIGRVLGDVAYNNLGPRDSYSVNGFIVSGPQAPAQWSQGFRFVAQASGSVTRLTVPVQHLAGENLFTWSIYGDANGQLGTGLGVIGSAAGPDAGVPPQPAPVQIDADGSVALSSGTAYWLVGSGVGSSQGTWHANNQGVIGPRVYSQGVGPWLMDTQTVAAFRIEVRAQAACAADFDQNGHVDPVDIALFVNEWTQSISDGTLVGDWDHNGAVEPADVTAFVSTWFAALQNGGC